MKNIRYYFIIMLLSAVSLVSCERDYETDIINPTPPALEVLVKNAVNAVVPNATIKLYKEEAAWNAEGNPVTTKQTNAEGRVIFTADELQDPGFVYLITTNGALKVKSKTKFLLLNDGVTLFNVSLR